MSNNIQHSNEYLESNLDYINSTMKDLKTKVTKSIDYCENKDHTMHSSNEENKLYSKMNDIMNKYTSAQKIIMKKLDNEIEFVKFAGEKYDELDKKTKGEAEKL